MPIPSKDQPIDRKSAKTIVYNALKDWIVDGILKPGEKLVDTKIAQYFSVSRTPVREALQMLSDQDLVEVVPSKGTRVTMIDTEDLINVYKTLSCLHVGAVKLAFDQINRTVVDQLKKTNAEMIQAVNEKNYGKISEKDIAFHAVFLELSKNPYLLAYSNQLLVKARRAENLNFKSLDLSFKSVREHELIIEAIEKVDKDLAIQAMEANWLRFIEEDFKQYNS